MARARKYATPEVGDQFGRWTVIGTEEKVKDKRFVLCRCRCGITRGVNVIYLQCGLSRSCGCEKRELSSQRFQTHGQTGTRLFRIWCGMKARCAYESQKCFQHYGGRGIKVCLEWQNSFEAFGEWALRSGYAADLQIDRKDTNGNYAPDNCHWVTQKRNKRNRRSNHIVSAFGETKTIAEWAEDERCKVNARTLQGRIGTYKMDAERAISTPPLRRPAT